MRSFVTALGAALAVLGAGAARPADAGAQTTWNDARSRQVVELATARRAQQLADTGLVDYRATAHGYLTFLAQLGEGWLEPPKIVKADELALEVYWKSPNLSKQRIIGRRDTLLLPTDIQYHRDHLGIVQNNFPDIIRLGEGDEVRDVPHPLSARGLAEYDFTIADSLKITIPGRAIDVYQVKVRPKNDRAPRIVGALFIDREGGQVVRMAFNFTRAAFLDRNLEDLSIVLENRLVSGRFWLPSRQEVEIRRTGRWLDYPVRGIIRGRWEVGDYQINQRFPAVAFTGPEIVQAPRIEQQRYPWKGRVLDSLPPDVRVTTDEDVRRVQEEARALVRAEALQRGRSAALSARGASEFVRFDRAEGLALGGGARQGLGAGLTVTARGRFGFDDHQGKGALTLGWQNANARGVRAFGFRDYLDAGDEAERSGVVNSVAAQEFASDYTDPYDVRAAGLGIDAGRLIGFVWTLEGGYRKEDPVLIRATPASGTFPGVLAPVAVHGPFAMLRAERPTALGWLGTEIAARAEARWFRNDEGCDDGRTDSCLVDDVWRAAASLQIERPIGTQRIVARTLGAVVGSNDALPTQSLAYFGGPISAPGYDYHSIAATAGVSQRLEWQFPVPFPRISLGRFGHVPARATLAPYANVVLARPVNAIVRGDSAVSLIDGWGSGWRGYPAVGVGLLGLFDLLRFDVSRGLRDGRWSFNVDVSREFWRIL